MINIGDRLRLNSAGPVLFAQEHGADAQVKCCWMDPMGQWHEAEFASADLRKLDEEADTSASTRGQGMGWSRVSSFVTFW